MSIGIRGTVFTLLFQEKYFAPNDVIYPQPVVLFQRKIFKWWFDHKGIIKWIFRKIPLFVMGNPKVKDGD